MKSVNIGYIDILTILFVLEELLSIIWKCLIGEDKIIQ